MHIPEENQSLYPLSVLETGQDILFFWVARMSMICSTLVGQAPFKEVLLHPMVRDKTGTKMSKSLGNVINPSDVIHGISLPDMIRALESGNLHPSQQEQSARELRMEFPHGIPQCGADSLRFTLASYMQQGNNNSAVFLIYAENK
jgi:valyl-tRNA synthetase